jgi:hypothetical protein
MSAICGKVGHGCHFEEQLRLKLRRLIDAESAELATKVRMEIIRQ